MFTTGHCTDGRDTGCRACGEKENQIHLLECPIIRQEFWQEIIALLGELGMEAPTDVVRFLALGQINDVDVMPKELNGVMFIAWRCIYAEIQRSREDDKPLDTGKALSRTMSMIYSRLKAYTYKWTRWLHTGIYTRKVRVIPHRHRDKIVVAVGDDDSFVIHQAITSRLHNLGLQGRSS